jgi:hypothetical protein
MSRRRSELSSCLFCERKFHAHYSSFGKYYSLNCQHKYLTKLETEKWLISKNNPINTNGLLRPWARKYLFEKFGNKCCLYDWRDE